MKNRATYEDSRGLPRRHLEEGRRWRADGLRGAAVPSVAPPGTRPFDGREDQTMTNVTVSDEEHGRDDTP